MNAASIRYRTFLALFALVIGGQAMADENAGIFFFGAPPAPEQVVAAAEGALTEISSEGAVTRITARWPDVTLTVTIDPAWDRDTQLAGMRNWIVRFPIPGSQVLPPPAVRLFRNLARTTTAFGSAISPAYDPDGKVAGALLRLVAPTGGFFFSHQSFYDESGTRIVGEPGDPPRLAGPRPAAQSGAPRDKAAPPPSAKADGETETTQASPEALARRDRSDAILRAEGVPINEWLPPIESEAESKRRTTDEIAYRALALLVVAVKAECLEQPIVDKIIRDYGLEDHFTPKEQTFLASASPTERERIQFTWRYEAAWTLLWALGYVEDLGKPTAICDVPRAVGFMKDRSTQQFIADAKLRPLSGILDQADRIYRYHWAVVDARLNGKPSPAGLEPGVALERHHALNWLIGYQDQDWDDISTDT